MTNYLSTLALFLLLFPLAAEAGMVNINTADAALLDTLPGIGPAKAVAIIEYRSAHGPFATIEALQEVKGIGPSTFANLKSSITVTGGDARVLPAAKAQPAARAPRSNEKQTVESVTQDPVTVPAHAEEAITAPEGAATAALSGALVPSFGDLATSKWTLFLVALVALAGGALMVL